MEYADAEMLHKRLKRALIEEQREMREPVHTGKATPTQIESYRTLFDNIVPQSLRVMRRVVADYNAERVADVTPMTAEQVDAVTRHFREVLDLAPLSKPARAVFRPLWPMTLAQLRAQVAELPPEEPRTNPAPLILRERAVQRQHPSFNVGRALAARSDVDTRAAGVDPQTQADYRALEGIAWNLSAPEGFPPYPRRGGVYSEHEAHAITNWIENHWPVLREAAQIAKHKDRERANAGISPTTLGFLLKGYGGGEYSFLDYFRDYAIRHDVLPRAADKSPRDFHAEILRWAQRRLFPTLDAIKGFDLALLERQADPDAHMRGLADSPVTEYAVRDAARYFYNLTPYEQEWTKALTGRDRAEKPVSLVSAYPERDTGRYSKTFPLSVLLAAQGKNDAEFKARQDQEQAGAARDRAAALPKLRAMLDAGRAFTRANVQAALPGYTLSVYPTTHTTSVHLRGPSSGVGIEYGDGRTLTDALAKLRYKLGL